MSTTQTFVCRIIGTRLHGIFFWWLKNYFCSRLKIHRKISLKKVTIKKWLFKNVTSETQFPQLINLQARESSLKHLFIGYKGNTKVSFLRYVWTPLLKILTFKLGFKMLILVSECNVCNMESPSDCIFATSFPF